MSILASIETYNNNYGEVVFRSMPLPVHALLTFGLKQVNPEILVMYFEHIFAVYIIGLEKKICCIRIGSFVAFCLKFKRSLRAKPFISLEIDEQVKHIFIYEWFGTKTLFDTKAKGNSEMAV